ncbi:serine/threonine-protein kinase [Planctomicrobium sp. SH661]|uniref:serine/threonine-protein kinase n=1 Tax=Planctomicrobium sp. SH661 TaxID=3448124 RepID=UPI003F5B583C
MAALNESADVPPEWIDRMVRLDESVRSGSLRGQTSADHEQREAERLMLNLQAMHAPSQTPSDPQATMLPGRIGRYEVQRMLGAGGFAVVYLARDPRLLRDVAVKIPLPSRLINLDTRQRFIQEAQLAAQLDHPHIVPAFEAGEEGPVPFIAYAYCSGPTLAAWIQDHGPMPPEDAARLISRLADAVAYSHERGILHRDLKPANVLLFPSTRVNESRFPFTPKLSDFGLAKLMESAAADTCSSMILGSPLYMAPEQVESMRNVSLPLADVYGLGGILYELLTGRPAIQGETVILALESIRAGKIEKLRKVDPRIPHDLAMICEKSLATTPEDRYQSAAELRDDLFRFLKGERISARPVSAGVLAVRSLQSPSRIREASRLVMTNSIALIFWTGFWPVGSWFGLPLPNWMPSDDLISYTAPLIAQALLTIWLGERISKHKEWAAAIVTIAGMVLCFYVTLILGEWIPPPYPRIYANQGTRDIVYLLLFSLFAMQTMWGGCAWLAIRQSRHRKTALR